MDPSSFSECTVFVGEREGEVLSRLEAVPAVAAPSSSGSLFLPGFEKLDTDENEASLGTILQGEDNRNIMRRMRAWASAFSPFASSSRFLHSSQRSSSSSSTSFPYVGHWKAVTWNSNALFFDR